MRNVTTFTRIPRDARQNAEAVQAERRPWGTEQVRTFLLGIRKQRLILILLLSLMGVRPAEVAGLRWVDVDLDAGTLAVVATLRTFRKRRAEERLASGPGYAHSGHVLVDEAGEPWRTDWLRRAAYKLMNEVGVRRVRLHDARHAGLTYLATSGVPDAPAGGVRRPRPTALLARSTTM